MSTSAFTFYFLYRLSLNLSFIYTFEYLFVDVVDCFVGGGFGDVVFVSQTERESSLDGA